MAAGASNVELKGRIHRIGAGWKTTATNAKVNLRVAPLPVRPWLLLKCVAFYTLFVIYRAYRGFFIIVPAVFKEVEASLKKGMIEAENELNADVDPATGKLRPRSAIVITIGATMVTFAYSVKTLIGGLWKGASQAVAFARDTEVSKKAPKEQE